MLKKCNLKNINFIKILNTLITIKVKIKITSFIALNRRYYYINLIYIKLKVKIFYIYFQVII